MLNSFKPTPLVKLATLSNALDAQIYLKLERYNPGGSIKDRPAKYIIDQAEQKGLLKPGGVIILDSAVRCIL
jgi:cystathionine beta-synthase/cysteine synthase A